MKKLYCAEVSGEFVFVVDSDKVNEDRAMDEAYQYASDTKLSLNVDNVSEIESKEEIPCEWNWIKPLGTENDDDCESYFEFKDEAERIKAGLEALDYELEDSFVEDIRELLKQEM